ncbi:MAG: hypothetical protein ACREON_14450 [Gemmatimonadaceae bacterium]
MRFLPASAMWGTLAALLALSMPAAAQHTASVLRPVRVAVPDEFPTPGARALIVRSPAAGQGDVIILNHAHATAEALSAALALLRELRRSIANPPHTQVVTMQGFTARGAIDRGTLEPLKSRLDLLRSRRPARIGNLGMGKWIELPGDRR